MRKTNKSAQLGNCKKICIFIDFLLPRRDSAVSLRDSASLIDSAITMSDPAVIIWDPDAMIWISDVIKLDSAVSINYSVVLMKILFP